MKIGALKTTITGGLVFLVPLGILIIVVAKVFEMMSFLATPFSNWIPVDKVAGIAVANIVTTILIVAICYIAGLVASLTYARKFYSKLDEKLMVFLPRYTFIKSMTGSIAANEAESALTPVLVTFDDQAQIGFEVERSENGLVTVYLPGAPDSWSGAVAHVTTDRIKSLDADFKEIVSSFKKAGVGASALARRTT